MRIVLIVPRFPALSETFIVNKFVGLLERGHDVWIVCGESDPHEWERFPRLSSGNARRRVLVDWRRRPYWLAALLLPAALARCLRANPRVTITYLTRGGKELALGILKPFYSDARIIQLGPGIVHFEFGALAVGRLHLPASLNAKLAVSFRGHDLNFVGLEDPHYYEHLWRKSDRIHLLGEDLWARASKRGCPENKPHDLIPPAVDVQTFHVENRRYETVGTADRPVRLLSVARLHWAKGHEFALKAMRELADGGRSVEYRIAGPGDYLDAVAFCRHQLSLEDIVQLLGPLRPDELLEHLEWADVFVHAAVSEGFSNAVIEAQAAGLPVVCSDADGLTENVVDGVTGFVVQRRDATALAARIKELADDASLRETMGKAGQDRVANAFALDQQLDALERFYRDLMNSTPADRTSAAPDGASSFND